ncbi:Uncharacterized protein At4g26485 [Linum grandiflorum]
MSYNSSQKILPVGEGDFSFSASLALSFARENIAALKARGCLVIHKLDATTMAEHASFDGMKFDRIVFNSPYAGYFKAETSDSQIRRHQKLIRSFMENAKEMVKEGGEVHITHKTNAFHKDWDLEGLASGVGLRLLGKVKFNFAEYPGYSSKRVTPRSSPARLKKRNG